MLLLFSAWAALKMAPHTHVVICYSDSEARDYMLLVRRVIPANLGFSFTQLYWGHHLRLESTGNRKIHMAYQIMGLVYGTMYLLILVYILQSSLLAVHCCPSLCTCSYGNSGTAELRLSETDFILISVFVCLKWFVSPSN